MNIFLWSEKMKLDNKNIFLGAKVSTKGTFLYVYKVNAKSFYAGDKSFPQFEELYSNRPSKQTFKDFCKQNHFLMYEYTDFDITEEELKKKIDAPVKASKSKSSLIGKAEKLVINKILADYTRKKKSIYCLTIDVGRKTLFILKKDSNKLLINIDGTYILYNTETEKTVELGSVYDINFTENTVPWEKVA